MKNEALKVIDAILVIISASWLVYELIYCISYNSTFGYNSMFIFILNLIAIGYIFISLSVCVINKTNTNQVHYICTDAENCKTKDCVHKTPHYEIETCFSPCNGYCCRKINNDRGKK